MCKITCIVCGKAIETADPNDDVCINCQQPPEQWNVSTATDTAQARVTVATWRDEWKELGTPVTETPGDGMGED